MRLISLTHHATLLSVALATVPAFAQPEQEATPEPPPITAPLDDAPLIGDKDDLIYVRDPQDFIRLYPHMRLGLDGHGFIGSHVSDIAKTTAGADLGPRFFVREARLGLGGEVLQRAGFDVGLDLVANRAIDGVRVDGTKTSVALSNAWVTIEAGRGLALTIGHLQAPFSLENRTATSDLPMLERNIAIRGFAVPGGKVLGTSIGGATHDATWRWDFGAFGAESLAPGEFQRLFEGMGRLSWRPFAANADCSIRGLQIGASGRVGSRNRRDASDDAPAIATGQGFALFRPTIGAGAQAVHIIPTGLQMATGLELRLPVHGFVVRSEAYWVSTNTEESVNPERISEVERRGRLSGVGWYVEVSAWILQLFGTIEGEPPALGEFPKPEHLELAQLPAKPERYGFEVAFIAAGVNATYEGAARGGKAPAIAQARSLNIFQFGGVLNYWQTKRMRLSLAYNLYWAPHSDSARNMAVVPGNLASEPDRRAHTVGELGARAMVMF